MTLLQNPFPFTKEIKVTKVFVPRSKMFNCAFENFFVRFVLFVDHFPLAVDS